MGTAHRCRIHSGTFWLPGLLGCIMLFVPAAATDAAVIREREATNVPSSQRASVSRATFQDTYAPLNLVVGQSLGSFETLKSRKRQAQSSLSQRLVVTAGLAVVACLAMAFAVLQCARKALFPRSFGSTGKRALSDSDLEEQWIDVCSEEEVESEGEGGEAGAIEDENLSEEAGESKALQALQKLRCLMNLATQTIPHLPSGKKATFLLLLLTISTQELALYGVYSTLDVEVQRQKTIEFILEQGEQAVTELCVHGESSNAKRRAKRMLRFLEQLKTPPAESNWKELFVEASISSYRISQCYDALQQLQPWRESSGRIPKDVSEAVLKVLSYTRGTAKRRLKADVAANSWVEATQTKAGFNGIFELRYELKSFMYHMPFKEEMTRIMPRYRKLAKTLACRIQRALSLQPLEHNLQEPPQYGEQQEDQDLMPLNQQHHHLTSQVSALIAAPRAAVEPAERPVTAEAGVEVLPSNPFRPMPAASQGALQTQASPLLDPPLLQLSQLPLRDSRQHIPTAYAEHWEEPSLGSAPGWQTNQQEKNLHQSSPDCFAGKAIFPTEEPVLAPREPQHTEVQRRTSPISSLVMDIWRPVTSTTGFASLWQSDYAFGDAWRPGPPHFGFSFPWKSAIPLAPPIPTQRQSEYLETVLPTSIFADESRTTLHTQHRFHQVVPGPSVASPQPRQRAEGPSPGLHRPTFQSPTSDIQQNLSMAYHQYWGGQAKPPSVRFEAPAVFWPPESGGAQGGLYVDSSRENRELNPVLDLIAEAFPEAGSHWSARARQARQGGEVRSRVPLSNIPPPSGGCLELLAGSESRNPVPKGNQGASPASGGDAIDRLGGSMESS